MEEILYTVAMVGLFASAIGVSSYMYFKMMTE